MPRAQVINNFRHLVGRVLGNRLRWSKALRVPINREKKSVGVVGRSGGRSGGGRSVGGRSGGGRSVVGCINPPEPRTNGRGDR